MFAKRIIKVLLVFRDRSRAGAVDRIKMDHYERVKWHRQVQLRFSLYVVLLLPFCRQVVDV